MIYVNSVRHTQNQTILNESNNQSKPVNIYFCFLTELSDGFNNFEFRSDIPQCGKMEIRVL